MKTVKLQDLRAGMILTADVHDRSGRLLLEAGGRVGERHLRIFRMWGVSEAQVQDEAEDPAAPAAARAGTPTDQEHLKRAAAAARRRFSRTDLEHPAIAELFAACVERIAARTAKER